MRAPIYVGTSGWAYKHWVGSFYPPGVKQADQLAYFATQFPSVEVNFTYYRLATEQAVARWKSAVPADFLFVFKGSRFITHMKRLKDPALALSRFFGPLEGVLGQSGPVLWQLPPNFRCDDAMLERLDAFLELLPKTYRHTVEFRHLSWHEDDRVLSILKRHRVARVWVSSLAMPMDTRLTTDFVFLRFHGLERTAHHHYTRSELQPWADALLAAKVTSYAYFNNDLNPRVDENARLLQKLVEPRTVHPRERKAAHAGSGGYEPANEWRAWGTKKSAS